MEIVFIRHGHGEHLLNYPNCLDLLHPALTEYGKMQVEQLKRQINIYPEDFILASPTKRTIETASILAPSSQLYTSPIVGPRMFPQNVEFPSFGCDQIYMKEEIASLYKSISIVDFDFDCWKEGINRINQELFESYARQLLQWCADKHSRIIIISHDGTITNYRILLGEHGLTRDDFLGEAGIHITNV